MRGQEKDEHLVLKYLFHSPQSMLACVPNVRIPIANVSSMFSVPGTILRDSQISHSCLQNYEIGTIIITFY